MSEVARIYMEVGFNILYLLIIWALVILMSVQLNKVAIADEPVANRIRWAFLLLAIGDTGHVGFRVLAYALGGLEQNPMLVGLGALATAITITFFYLIMLDTWKTRYNTAYGWFEYLLFGTVIVRFIVMALPGNDWGSTVPPLPMGPIRNVFLMLLGFGVLYLILRDSIKTKDRMFQRIAICIFFSYLFYTPVVFFVQINPLLGMLMIPKTVMYVIIAFLAYYGLWPHQKELAILPSFSD